MDMRLPDSGATERRRDARLALHLSGRYKLHGCQEYPCSTLNISPGGVALLGMARGCIGERVVAYLSPIGRLEGMVVRHFGASFAVKLTISPNRRLKLAEQLASYAVQSV